MNATLSFAGNRQHHQLPSLFTSNVTTALQVLTVATTTVTAFQFRLLTLVNLLYAVLVIPIGVVGNVVTVVVAVCLVRNRRQASSSRKSVPDICVCLLAIVDFASVLFVQTPAIMATLGGENATHYSSSLLTTTTTTTTKSSGRNVGALCSFESLSISVYVRLQLVVQVAAAVDRYAALSHPLRYHRVSSSRILRSIGATLGVVGLATVGISLVTNVGRRERSLTTWSPVCVFEWRRLSGTVDYAVALITAVSFLGAFGVFIGCNSALVCILWRYHARRADEAGVLREISTAMEAVGGTGGGGGRGGGNARDRALKRGPQLYRNGHDAQKNTEDDRIATENRKQFVLPQKTRPIGVADCRHSPTADDATLPVAAECAQALGCCSADLPFLVIEPPTNSATIGESAVSADAGCSGIGNVTVYRDTMGSDEGRKDILVRSAVERRRSSEGDCITSEHEIKSDSIGKATGNTRLPMSFAMNFAQKSLKKSVSFACSPTVVVLNDLDGRSTSGRRFGTTPSGHCRSDDADISRNSRTSSDGRGNSSVTRAVPRNDVFPLPVRPKKLLPDGSCWADTTERRPSLRAAVHRVDEQQAINLVYEATDRVAYVEHQLQKLLRKAERKTRNQRRRLYLMRLVIVCAVVYVISWIPYAVRFSRNVQHSSLTTFHYSTLLHRTLHWFRYINSFDLMLESSREINRKTAEVSFFVQE